jgi:protein-tyrosine phosphatase
MGNICRSPAAEGVFRHCVEKEGLNEVISCDSAGTIDFHQGSAPDSRVRQTGLDRGFEIEGSARHVSEADLREFDLILAMDYENIDYVRNLDRDGQFMKKIQLFCDFVQGLDDKVVPDPYYGGQDGFEKVFDLLEDGSEGLLTFIRGQLALDK